jgi:nitronate monooxygenase
MRSASDLCSKLDIEHPVVQAPMAGSTTPELVAAVSNAGGLGMLGAANMTPSGITDAIEAIRALTDKPFGVNLFAGGREDAREVDPAGLIDVLSTLHAELGLPAPEAPGAGPDPFPEQVQAVLAARIPVFSFTFGIPKPDVFTALHAQRCFIVGTATTVEEARLLVSAGVDAVVA